MKYEILQRFWGKVLKTDYCWLWIGATHRGYGIFHLSGKSKIIRAHRFAYQVFKGPVPAGLVIDHLCLTPLCVNPDHLEAVTHRENTMRGIGPSAESFRKSECKFGHQLVGKNLYVVPRTRVRQCRICHRARSRQTYARRRQHET